MRYPRRDITWYKDLLFRFGPTMVVVRCEHYWLEYDGGKKDCTSHKLDYKNKGTESLPLSFRGNCPGICLFTVFHYLCNLSSGWNMLTWYVSRTHVLLLDWAWHTHTHARMCVFYNRGLDIRVSVQVSCGVVVLASWNPNNFISGWLANLEQNHMEICIRFLIHPLSA